MATDEHGTIAALDAARSVFRAQIESNGGRVIDTAGDSVLAVFDTAAGAVRAALAVQENLGPSLRFRIGVHLGDVIEKPDGTVYGDGVNIAARLQSLAEPGGILISDAVQGAVRGKIAASFVDQGEQAVKNIASPLRAFRVTVGGSSAPAGEIDLSVPSKPSIAVLPFTNMGGSADQEHFVDGVTEDVITELSRFRSLLVIARNSSFTYKGKAVDVRSVARELGVRYVLEGSVRRAENRVRVTAQLIDAVGGTHLWAERYDRVLEDIFAVQEELTGRIVAAIAPEIDAAEVQKASRKRPESLGAYELAVRASATHWLGYQKQERGLIEEALGQARAAIALDPKSVLGHVVLARAQWIRVYFRTAPDLREAWREGLAAATRAIELDRSDHSGHTWKGITIALAANLGEPVRWDDVIGDCQHGHELNPNDSFALQALGWVHITAGQPERGIEHLLETLRLNPRDPYSFNIYQILGFAYFLAKEYAKGLEWCERAISAAPDFAVAFRTIALCHVGLDDIGRARAAFEKVQRLAPELAQAWLEGVVMLRHAENRERYTRFLRIAAGMHT